MADLPKIIADLEVAIDALAPPFLALPEHGYTAEVLAYRRGVRDAYSVVLKALGEQSDG
jgi:hypothetical protein